MSEQNKNWYDKSYKLFLIIPAILIIIAIIYLVNFNAKNGDIVYKDVSLTGGTTITVFDANVDITELESALSAEFPDLVARGISDIRSGSQEGFFVETISEVEKIKPALESYLGYELTTDNSSIEFSGSTISSGFYQQLRFAVLISFALMAVVVFIIFRTPVRALSVIIAGFADIILTIFTLDLLGIPLSSAGIVALLMLIGYAVDTDILLTIRVLKNKDVSVNQRIFGAFKTGITMTLTAIAAILVALIITYSFSDTLREIFTVLLIGLVFDIINCWGTNASILKWYSEVKKTI